MKLLKSGRSYTATNYVSLSQDGGNNARKVQNYLDSAPLAPKMQCFSYEELIFGNLFTSLFVLKTAKLVGLQYAIR